MTPHKDNEQQVTKVCSVNSKREWLELITDKLKTHTLCFPKQRDVPVIKICINLSQLSSATPVGLCKILLKSHCNVVKHIKNMQLNYVGWQCDMTTSIEKCFLEVIDSIIL